MRCGRWEGVMDKVCEVGQVVRMWMKCEVGGSGG